MSAVLFEDEALLAVDKPAGALAVRGRLGEQEPSLVDALSKQRRERLWIVHRLDRGTSGVLLLARSAEAHRRLNVAFERGVVAKRYLALARGEPPQEQFSVDLALVPARRGKSRPAAAGESGKPACTQFRVLERFGEFALLEAVPRTGRTHQIRVHLKFAGFPLAVDPLYAGVERLSRAAAGLEPAGESLLARPPLHARALELRHPFSGAPLRIEAPLAPDFAAALEALRARARSTAGRQT